jgi:hypothetical protein
MFGWSPQQLLVAVVVLLALQQRMAGAADGGPGAADGGPGAANGGPWAADGGPGAEEEKEERLWRDLDQVKLELGEMEKVKSDNSDNLNFNFVCFLTINFNVERF